MYIIDVKSGIFYGNIIFRRIHEIFLRMSTTNFILVLFFCLISLEAGRVYYLSMLVLILNIFFI